MHPATRVHRAEARAFRMQRNMMQTNHVVSKYFIAVSKMNGLVMSVEGEMAYLGARVVMKNRRPSPNNADQQWWFDMATNTIRSRLSDFCLDVMGGNAVINPMNMWSQNQKWILDETRAVIHSQPNPSMVLDIQGMNNQPGAAICTYQYKMSNNQNQLWNFEFQQPEYIYIVSEMHDKVLEVEGGKKAPGTRVCMNRKTDAIHQQWYESRRGLRSRINDLPLTTATALTDAAPLVIKPFPGEPKPLTHFWQISQNKIVNCANENYVCDIEGQKGSDGVGLVAFPYKGQANQHWRFIPL